MADNTQIIELYTELAENPNKDFGWAKGLENAKAHGYKQAWIEKIPSTVWEFCAAVGNPFKDAKIKEGDTVLDLGCGAGVDVLVASHLVGENGKVYGVDITPKMVETTREHAKLMDVQNVTILNSSFDDVTLEDESVDVVISNGAINLTSCKESVFAEIYRVLKPKGKIYFADMIDISIDEGACCSVEKSSCCESQEEDWANCVAGTLREAKLIEIIKKAGFKDVVCTGLTHYSTADTTQGATFSATKIPSPELREKHWDEIFKRKDYTQVLWHQENPQYSLQLIQKYTSKDDTIIDVGCGASLLVDKLIENGYQDITLLDTSSTCLNIVKERLNSTIPTYICSDILDFKATNSYRLWHDRAVFHFLLTKMEQDKYFDILAQALIAEGMAIIHTFAKKGEVQCAGLHIRGYNELDMRKALPKSLELIGYQEFVHTTPRNTQQKYNSFIIKLKS